MFASLRVNNYAKDFQCIYYETKNCCWVIRQNQLNKENLSNLLKDKNDLKEKKKNLEKLTNQNTWNNINKKLINLINEN